MNVDKCERRIQLLEQQSGIPEVQNEFIKPYQETMDYLEEKTGMDVKTPLDFSTLYLTLKTEEGAGLKLPEWTEKVYPKIIYKVGAIAYRYMNYFKENRIINSGMTKII